MVHRQPLISVQNIILEGSVCNEGNLLHLNKKFTPVQSEDHGLLAE